MCFLCSQMQLSKKEVVQMEIQDLLEHFYTKQGQNGNNNRLSLFVQSLSRLLLQNTFSHPLLMAWILSSLTFQWSLEWYCQPVHS